MNKEKEKNIKKKQRHNRVRAKIKGTSARSRLCIFKSNTSIYLQLIDDESAKTIVSAHSRELKGKTAKATKTEQASAVGKILAERALKKKISKVIFDRGGNLYHGRVKAAADGAREGGLKF